MERDEAKKILELCRPGVAEDLQDPALEAALALLETDAELADWFESQQAVDERISRSLHTIEAPADLKNTILAGMRLHEANRGGVDELEGTIPFPESSSRSGRSWWLNPWTGIAALFVIMMVILNLPDSPPRGTQVADADLPPVLQFLSKEISTLKSWEFDKKDQDPMALRAFLTSSNAPSPHTIPQGLGGMSSIGCVTFDYNEDAKLSMICFKNGEVYHLITADKATYPDAIPDEPVLYQCQDKAYKLWVDGDQVKILTIHGSKEEMPEFI
jgi:hypothetical protein